MAEKRTSHSTISQKDWNKFVKGWANANVHRTNRQVAHDDTQRQLNWKNN